jgi:hypothetical protein
MRDDPSVRIATITLDGYIDNGCPMPVREAWQTIKAELVREVECGLKCLSGHCTLKQGYCHNLKVVANSSV